MSVTTKVQNRLTQIQADAQHYDSFEYPIVAFTVRAGADLRLRLDLLADTLGYQTRNGLVVDLLEEAINDASAVLFAEIKQGGSGGYLTSEGLNFQEAVIAGLEKLRTTAVSELEESAS
jgi:hypothetical protein